MIAIAIVDYGTGTTEAGRAAVANAIATQVRRDFAPHWLATAEVRAATAAEPPRADDWILGLYAQADQPDALGHHDVTDAGLPLIKVFPLLDTADGMPWSATASHEVLEALADPWCGRCVQVPDGRIAALEVCDPVEQLLYWIDGVAVSDFVLPSFFEPPRKPSAAYDLMGTLKAPLDLAPGGYNQWWSPTAGWTMQTTMQGVRAGRVATAKAGLGRAARRRRRQGAA